MTASASSPTYSACLTPPGVGAIAALGVHGVQAWSVMREIFRPISRSAQGLPEKPIINRIWVGRLAGDISDEVVLTVRQAQPVPWLELHCHGGREAIRLLLETLEAHGITTCSWREFEQITSGRPLRAAVAAALAEACTVRTAAILLDQYHGALANAVQSALDALDRNDLEVLDQILSELSRYSRLGRRLTAPWRVVLAGAPNVGKSSLVNALAGFQRSIVAATPGTTRDVVTTLLAVDGWSVELIDTAGLRPAAPSLEALGIEQARQAAANADLCLWVLDASNPPVWPEASSFSQRLIINKTDLEPAWDLNQVSEALRVSAHTGAGLAELCQALSAWLAPDVPPAGAAVPFHPELCDLVDQARAVSTTASPLEIRKILRRILGRVDNS